MSVSDKKVVAVLTGLFKAYGITDIVLSPGSRNAPLVISFAGDKSFKCITIVDERSAAFFALGMAVHLKRPVALVCTSGSALLNYAPAISEAYYRHIPLMVLSADRPPELIDQGDGQTIRQAGALDEHLNYSCSLPSDIHDEDEAWHVNRLINEAIINCNIDKKGPVHLNVPFREPLYGKTGRSRNRIRAIDFMKPGSFLSPEQLEALAGIWNSSSNILILLGESEGPDQLNDLLNKIGESKQAVVLTETLSNVNGKNIFFCIDRIISCVGEEEAALFQPDLLITTSGAVVSKMIKSFLRNNPPKYHWQVSEREPLMDTYKCMTHSVPLALDVLLSGLLPLVKDKKPRYFELWKRRFERSLKNHERFLPEASWCDLKVFDTLSDNLPAHYTVHWGNSTAVRYAQLFDEFHRIKNFSNRGTSGIDGSVSTAAGYCFASGEDTLLVTGDLSFMYDSNGLWNKYLTPKLKIIVVNNGGGGIFRFIPGPADSGFLDEHFEAGHNRSVQPLTEMYGLDYLVATNDEDFKKLLPQFFAKKNRPVVFEILTPKRLNAKVLKKYFEYLKEMK